MTRLIPFCVAVLLIGCAGPAETPVPGGKESYEVTCSGNTWERCYEKAEELCPAAGYRVLTKYEDYSRRIIPRSLLITCRPTPSGESPDHSPEASRPLSSEANCCAELTKLSQQRPDAASGSRLVQLSDPLEIALIEAVRSALPRNELEALVRMLSSRAPQDS